MILDIVLLAVLATFSVALVLGKGISINITMTHVVKNDAPLIPIPTEKEEEDSAMAKALGMVEAFQIYLDGGDPTEWQKKNK